jgi:hypothetical protein
MARKRMFGAWAALAAGLATPALAGPYRVLEIEPATVIAVDSPEARNPAFFEACEAWSPTPEQAARFLDLSEPIPRDGSFHAFNYLPCQTRGVAEKDGVRWSFEINAAAHGVLWREGEESRLIGCRRPECEALLLLMPDGPGSDED